MSLVVIYEGQRKIVKIPSPNTLVQALLLDCATQFNVDVAKVAFRHKRTILDNAQPIRFCNLSNNAQVDLIAVSGSGSAKNQSCKIALAIDGGENTTETFDASISLYEMLSLLATQSKIPADIHQRSPEVVYLRAKYEGFEALTATTFTSLGLAGKSARLQLRFSAGSSAPVPISVPIFSVAEPISATIEDTAMGVVGTEEISSSPVPAAHVAASPAKPVSPVVPVELTKNTESTLSEPHAVPASTININNPVAVISSNLSAPPTLTTLPSPATTVSAILSDNFDRVSVPAVLTLARYLLNILLNPLEDKFRRISTENKAFQGKIATAKGAVNFLCSVGFVYPPYNNAVLVLLPADSPVATSESGENSCVLSAAQLALLQEGYAQLLRAMKELEVPVEERPYQGADWQTIQKQQDAQRRKSEQGITKIAHTEIGTANTFGCNVIDSALPIDTVMTDVESHQKQIVSVMENKPQIVVIVRLDWTNLTTKLIDQIAESFASETKFLDLTAVMDETDATKNIDKLAGALKITGRVAISHELNNALSKPFVVGVDASDHDIPLARVLIFCGHSNYSGGLTAYMPKLRVENIIRLVSPTVVAFFGCDVGRPRDGFILELSHSHPRNEGPIYAAFVRKVTVENVMESSLLHGIKQYAAQCCLEDFNALTDQYNVARYSFASEISRHKRSCDGATFFNDTRVDTTTQQFMRFAAFPTLDETQKNYIVDLARYHSWTFGLRNWTNRYISGIDSALSHGANSATIDSLLHDAGRDLKINDMQEMEGLAMSIGLSRRTIKTLALGGNCTSINNHDYCAAMYYGYHGHDSFLNIVIRLAHRLVESIDVGEFRLIGAVLILIDEKWFAKPGVGGDDFSFYYYPLDLQVGFANRKNIKFPPYKDAPKFDPALYLGSIAPWYAFCKLNTNFGDLFAGRKEFVDLSSWSSLVVPFKRNFPAEPHKYTSTEFRVVLKVAADKIRQMSQLKISDRPQFIANSSNDVRTDIFSNDGNEGTRLQSFPCKVCANHTEVSLWFMEMYPLPDNEWKKMFRCRFVVALPEELQTLKVSKLDSYPEVTAYVYYTDSHYGQDVYAAGKKITNKKNIVKFFVPDGLLNVNEPKPGSFDWHNNFDYKNTTCDLCKKERFFPFEYIGRMHFNLRETEARVDFDTKSGNDYQDIPDFFD